MADPRKMTLAELLAAAAKADSPGGAAPAKPAAAQESAAESPADAPAEASAPAETPKPKPAPAGKMSVAEMLAAARGEKAAGAAPKPAAPKPEKVAKPAAEAK